MLKFMFGFAIATEEGPFGAETSCSQNKCTVSITLKNHLPFYPNNVSCLVHHCGRHPADALAFLVVGHAGHALHL